LSRRSFRTEQGEKRFLFGYLSIAGSYFSFYLLLKLKTKFKFNPRL
jgi:hypothetical protein